MTADIPVYLKVPVDRSATRAVVSFCAGFALVVFNTLFGSAIFGLLAVVSFLFALGFTIHSMVRLLGIPKELELIQQAKERAERFAVERERREQAWKLAAQENEERRVAECKERVVEALSLIPGEDMWLRNREGELRVQRCINGNLRVWWPYNSRLMPIAVSIVKGRGRYDGEPAGWFVDRDKERFVLMALADI